MADKNPVSKNTEFGAPAPPPYAEPPTSAKNKGWYRLNIPSTCSIDLPVNAVLLMLGEAPGKKQFHEKVDASLFQCSSAKRTGQGAGGPCGQRNQYAAILPADR